MKFPEDGVIKPEDSFEEACERRGFNPYFVDRPVDWELFKKEYFQRVNRSKGLRPAKLCRKVVNP